MRDCAESCTQGNKDENGKLSGVCCHFQVVRDFQEGRFCILRGTETGLRMQNNPTLCGHMASVFYTVIV